MSQLTREELKQVWVTGATMTETIFDDLFDSIYIFNSDGTLSGPTGATGATGNGIVGATVIGGNLILVYTNGNASNLGPAQLGPTGVTGPKGATGSQGVTGATGPYPFFYQNTQPTGTGTSSINEGSFWFDNEYGNMYVYINDGDSYQWVSPISSVPLKRNINNLEIDILPNAEIINYDFNGSSDWYHDSGIITQNFIPNFINVPTIDNRSIELSITIDQNSSAYLPSSIQINGTNFPIKWKDSIIPTSQPFNLDRFIFNLIRFSNDWKVLCELKSYGI